MYECGILFDLFVLVQRIVSEIWKYIDIVLCINVVSLYTVDIEQYKLCFQKCGVVLWKSCSEEFRIIEAPGC